MKKILLIMRPSLNTFNIAKDVQEIEGVELLAVVLEKKQSNEKLKRILKNYGIKAVGILAFKIINQVLKLSKNERYDFNDLRCPIYEVDDINSDNTEKIIQDMNDQGLDYVFVKNVGIIKKHIIDCAKNKIINFHGGILPNYRGVQCGFWPVRYCDFENIGVTGHIVDYGLDTGKVLIKRKIDVNALKSYSIFNFHNEISTTQHSLISKMIADITEEKFNENYSQYNTTKYSLYSYPTLRDYSIAVLNMIKFRRRG